MGASQVPGKWPPSPHRGWFQDFSLLQGPVRAGRPGGGAGDSVPEVPCAQGRPSGVRRMERRGEPPRAMCPLCVHHCPPEPLGASRTQYSPDHLQDTQCLWGVCSPPLLENTGPPVSLSRGTRPSATIRPVDTLFPGALSLASALTLPTQGLGLSPWLDRGCPKRCSILHALHPTWALDRRPTAADTENLRH